MKFSPCLAALFVTGAAAQAVVNDECATAMRISQASPFVSIVNTTLATNNPKDPLTTCHEGRNDGNTVWYVYKAPTDGLLSLVASGNVTTPDQFGNTVLLTFASIFSGSCNNLKEFACQKHYIPDGTVLNQIVKAGQRYFIKVGDVNQGDGGMMRLTVSFEPNYFNISNAVTDQPIGLLKDMYLGDVFTPPGWVDYRYVPTSSLSVEAIFTPNPSALPIKSVRLTLDSPPISRCDNGPPFTLFGNAGRNLYGSPFPLGSRIVTATPYAKSGCSGPAGKMVSQSFDVVGCQYLRYSLYDAQKNTYIMNLYNASTVTSPPCQVNVRVDFSCGFSPSSVRLELRNAESNRLVRGKNETNAPYYLFGDNGRGDVNSGTIPAGEYIITAIIDGITHPSVRFTYGVCNPAPTVDNEFNVDLQLSFKARSWGLVARASYDNAKLFAPAVDRISSLIIGDRPDVLNTTDLRRDFFCGPYPPIVDDLHICAALFEYDGPGGLLGYMYSSYARESDGLPFTGTIVLDALDFDALLPTGDVGNFVLQQLIQVLGLGHSWEAFGLAELEPPCSYKGTKASMEFESITGCSSIPLEQSGSTDPFSTGALFNCQFWDQQCLKDEILTLSTGKKKISRITLGALEDLGYVVNYTAADPYDINDIGTCAGCGGRRTNEQESKVPSSSCHTGAIYNKAIHHGRKIMKQMHEHYESDSQQKLPEGVVYIGNRHISVAYIHEDGTLCSTIVTP